MTMIIREQSVQLHSSFFILINRFSNQDSNNNTHNFNFLSGPFLGYLLVYSLSSY